MSAYIDLVVFLSIAIAAYRLRWHVVRWRLRQHRLAARAIQAEGKYLAQMTAYFEVCPGDVFSFDVMRFSSQVLSKLFNAEDPKDRPVDMLRDLSEELPE